MNEETKAIGSHEEFFVVQDPTLVDAVARRKRCPVCSHIEIDYENTFCTEDGTTLVWDNGEGTSSRSNDPTIILEPNVSFEDDSLTVEELDKATAETVVLRFANATHAKRELRHTKRYWLPVSIVIAILTILALFAYRNIAHNDNRRWFVSSLALSQCRRRSKS